jgi:hypothetical protein
VPEVFAELGKITSGPGTAGGASEGEKKSPIDR